MKILPSFVRQAWILLGRRAARQAVRKRESLNSPPADVSLHMVISHDMLLMGLLAMRSLEFHSRQHWAPFFHDDGSLTDDDAREIRSHFPDGQVIRRAVADRAVAEGLRDHPVCRENRVKHHWFLKVFDTRHYAPHDRYIVIDSDIVFFQRPELVLQWIARGEKTLWLMEDTREKYSSARADLEKEMGFRLWERANSGLDLMPKAAADLGLAEKFLQRCAPTAREYCFLEQTLFCVFGSAWKWGGGLLPREYEISWTNFRRCGAVCRHYVGPFKNDALFAEGAFTFWLQNQLFRLKIR